MPLVSILIPCHEMGGQGARLLERALSSIYRQDLALVGTQDIVEIIVSDHSKLDDVVGVARKFCSTTAISLKYRRNHRHRGSASANLNYAFSESTGAIIKILFQDDFFVSDDALAMTVKAFEKHHSQAWLVCGSTHSRDGVTTFHDIVPRYHEAIHLGENTISSPSVLAVRRGDWVDFDKRLKWLLDVDVYRTLGTAHGPPIVLEKILIANGIGSHQVSARGFSALQQTREIMVVSRKHDRSQSTGANLEISRVFRKTLRKWRKRGRGLRDSLVGRPLAPSPAGQMTRADVINRIIRSTQAKSYLEIGVNTNDQPGYSRDEIVVDLKHGVDPNPLTAAEFHMTSDDFFHQKPTQTYDVVFIDGLHLFEQAFRDATNSLAWLTENGTIVIHDTRPTNRLSSSRTKGKTTTWHGDVWRTVLFLRLVFPDLSVTTVDTDEGLTIVRRSDRGTVEPFTVSFDDLFSWTSYTRNYRTYLGLVSETEFIRQFPIR